MKKTNNLPIGIFDSGIGGLTVVKEILKILPNENLIYFGDTARVPYGNKSIDTIIHFALQDSRFLLSKNVKAIVIACNTVSSNALHILKRSFNIPFIDVLTPNAILAAQTTKNNKIGIIGTHATIESKSYEKIIKAINENVKIYEKATPLLVPLAEEGWINKKASSLIIEEYLTPLLKRNIDTLLLGCTHYPLFQHQIQKICGKHVNVINSAKQTSYALKELLQTNNMLNNENGNKDIYLYLSDIPRNFIQLAKRFLKKEIIIPTKKIEIEKY